MKSFDRSLDRNDYNRELAEHWRELSTSIPFIKLDSDWTIAIIPPFAGVAARFLVKNSNSAEVSVYLDTADVLGDVGEVYWEVYPDAEGSNSRALLSEGELLVYLIRGGLEAQAK